MGFSQYHWPNGLLAGLGLPEVTIPRIHVSSTSLTIGLRSDDAECKQIFIFNILSLKSSIQQQPLYWLRGIMSVGNPNHLLATLLLLKGFTF